MYMCVQVCTCIRMYVRVCTCMQRYRSEYSWTHALLPNPCLDMPLPAMSEDVLWKLRPADGLFNGLAWSDGSGYHVNDARRARCGWGLVQIVAVAGEARFASVQLFHGARTMYNIRQMWQ